MSEKWFWTPWGAESLPVSETGSEKNIVIHIPERSNDTTYFCTGCGFLFDLYQHTSHHCNHFENSDMHKEMGISRTTGEELDVEETSGPKEIAEKAIDLVYGARNASYGHPHDDFTRTAGLWTAYLGVDITAHDAALMMVLLKLSREKNLHNNDNIVDAHGYLLVAGRIREREAGRE